MIKETQSRFDAGAEAWAEYNRGSLGRLRREVTWHNLAPHLPAIADPDHPPRVLDAGGGSGELALRLVGRGYCAWLLDYAPAMIAQAQQAARALPDGERARLTLCPMATGDAPQSFGPGFFDAITCHTLIEYVPDPRSTLRSLANLVCEGGLLSVSFVNRHAGVLRQVWSNADPAAALANLESGAFCATLFDVPGMAYTAGEVGEWLVDLGLTVVAAYGVRTFADFVPRERLDEPAFFEDLLRLETRVASLSPYRLLARYVHLIARRTAGS